MGNKWTRHRARTADTGAGAVILPLRLRLASRCGGAYCRRSGTPSSAQSTGHRSGLPVLVATSVGVGRPGARSGPATPPPHHSPAPPHPQPRPPHPTPPGLSAEQLPRWRRGARGAAGALRGLLDAVEYVRGAPLVAALRLTYRAQQGLNWGTMEHCTRRIK